MVEVEARPTEALQLYDQDTDLALLVGMLRLIENKRVVDVGAERGDFTSAFLGAGANEAYAFEPYPPNVAVLRERFGADARVRIFDCAVTDRDGTVDLHVALHPEGGEHDCYHSLVGTQNSPEITWGRNIPVDGRSLGSLVERGELPGEVGLLKVDTEGNDDRILAGMGRLKVAVVAAEFWDTLPDTVGTCPYTLDALAEIMHARGYGNFVRVKRWDEFELVQLNVTRTEPGDWGNVIFIHDSVFPRLEPLVRDATAESQAAILHKALAFRVEAERRLGVVTRLNTDVTETRQRSESVEDQADERLKVITDLNAQLQKAQARADRLERDASERLTAITDVTAQLQQAQARADSIEREANERLKLIEDLNGTLDERLRLIEELNETLDSWRTRIDTLQADADERVRVVDDLRVALTASQKNAERAQSDADERLRLIQQLTEQLNAIGDGRLHVIMELTAELQEAQARATQVERQADERLSPVLR